MALLPASLTVTFGFGPRLYQLAVADDRRPASVIDLPSLRVDRLQPGWSGGDLLLQICSDDPVKVAHAQRMLVKDARPFGSAPRLRDSSTLVVRRIRAEMETWDRRTGHRCGVYRWLRRAAGGGPGPGGNGGARRRGRLPVVAPPRPVRHLTSVSAVTVGSGPGD